MRDTAVYDFSAFVDFNNNIDPLLRQITRGQKSAAEAFASIADKVQSNIDSLYNDYINN